MYGGKFAIVVVTAWLVLSPVAATAGYGGELSGDRNVDSSVESRDVAGGGGAVESGASSVGGAVDREAGVGGRQLDVSAGDGRSGSPTVAAYRHLWPRSGAAASLTADNDTLTVSIAPNETYLHVNGDDAGRTEPINLTARDIQPGDRVRLTRLGEFEDGAAGQGMHAVFSTNATLRSGDARHRVPGAIDAGSDHETSATFVGSEPTDVPEDFLIADNAGNQTNVTVTVPAGAEYLFVAGKDNLYEDNSDPDGDFAVRVTVVEENVTVPEFSFLFDVPPETAGLRLAGLIEQRQLSTATAATQLGEMNPTRSGQVLGSMAVAGQREAAFDVLDRLPREQQVLDTLLSEESVLFRDMIRTGPRYDRIVLADRVLKELTEERRLSDAMVTRISERIEQNATLPSDESFMLRVQLQRLGSEREGVGEEAPGFFNGTHTDVTFSFDTAETSSSGGSKPARALSGSFVSGIEPVKSGEPRPGRGYDDRVQWQKLGATGFGAYRAVGAAEVGLGASFSDGKLSGVGAITALAGRKGSGGLWRKHPGQLAPWENVGLRLPAPYRVVDAAVDPTDEDHAFAIVPEDDYRFALYETEDGSNWTEVSYFTENVTLWDANDGTGRCGDCARVEVFGNGNVFVYSHRNDGLDDNDKVFYSKDGGDSWENGTIPVSDDARPGIREVMEFTDEGNGLLAASGKKIYRTSDYGRTWTFLGDYSQASGVSFGMNRNGSRVYVVYRRGKLFETKQKYNETLEAGTVNESLRSVFSNNGEQLPDSVTVGTEKSGKKWKITADDARWWVEDVSGGLKVFQTCCHIDVYEDGSKTTLDNSHDLPGKAPHATVVDPDDPSRLTTFAYMAGPYQSLDGGKTWDRLYNNKMNVRSPGGFAIKELNKNSPPSNSVPRPVDYRDVAVLDRVKNDPILVGSDQGLYLLGPPDKKGNEVSLTNVAARKDHGQVGAIQVDDCGNVYQGLWHQSAMVRPNGTENVYHVGGGETGGMAVKDRSNCLGFATKLDVVKGKGGFQYFVTNRTGTLQRMNGNSDFKFNVGNAYFHVDTHAPVFADGKWWVVNRTDSDRLFTATLNGWPKNTTQARHVRQLAEDTATGDVWIKKNNSKIQRFRSASQSPTTAVNLTGTDEGINYFQVYDNRVAAVIRNELGKDALLLADTTRADTITADNVTVTGEFGGEKLGEVTGDGFTVSKPFDDDVRILEAFVDPTNPDRYFATVKDRDNQGCPRHVMVTEDGGEHWERFSRQLDCNIVRDMAFNPETGKAYAATHGQGVLVGNVSRLNDAPDFSIDVTCDDRVVVETERVTCHLDIGVNGTVPPLWENVTNPVQAKIELPFNRSRFSIVQPSPNETTGRVPKTDLQKAGCYASDLGKDQADQVKSTPRSINCTAVLTQFPPDDAVQSKGNVSFDIRFFQIYDESRDELPLPLNATLEFKPFLPDVHQYNNHDATDMKLVQQPATDRFEDRLKYDPYDGENLSRGIRTDWDHTPSDEKHLACPDTPNYPGGNETVRRLERAGQNCASVLFDPSDDAPLTAHENYTQTVRELSLWTVNDVDVFNFSIPDIDTPLLRQRLDSPRCGVETVQMAASPARNSSAKRVLLGALFGEPHRPTLVNETVDADLRRSLNQIFDNGTLAADATVQRVGSNTWRLDGNRSYVIIDPGRRGGVLNVYLERTGTGGDGKTKRDVEFRVIRTTQFIMPPSYKQYFEDATPNQFGRAPVPDPVRQQFAQNGLALGQNFTNITVPSDRTWENTTVWQVIEPGETYYVRVLQNGSLHVYTRRQVVVDQEQRNVTIETRSWLEVTVHAKHNDLGVVYDSSLDAPEIHPRAFRTSDRATRLNLTIHRTGDTVTVRIPCPRSNRGLSSVLLAVGDTRRTAGTYNLEATYHTRISRPDEISRRKTESRIGPDTTIGQHDSLNVDVGDGWQRVPVDVEKLERKIAVSEIGINPVDPPDVGPGSRVDLSVSTLDQPTVDTPPLDAVLETAGGHPYIQVQHDRRFDGRGELTVEVSDETLAQNDLGTDQVALHRYDRQAGWEQLDTERVGSTADGQRYRAQFQGLSLFAVGKRTNQTGDGETTRTAPGTVAPGGQVTVTVTANATDGSAVTVRDFFQPAVESAAVERVAVDGEPAGTVLREAEPGGVVVTVDGANVDAGDTVTVEYTVSVAESAEPGSTIRINGSVVSAGTTDLGVDRLTVRERGPVTRYDDDGDDAIDITELGEAAADYVAGELNIVKLGDVAAAYAQS